MLLAVCLSLFGAAAAASNGNLFVTTDPQSLCTTGGNLTLAPDTCVSAPTTQPPRDGAFDSRAFHEFSVARFARCDNGTAARFVIFDDGACQTQQAAYDGDERLGTGNPFEGTCLGLLEFRSAAFVCAGSGSVNAAPPRAPTDVATILAPTTLPYTGTALASSAVAVSSTVPGASGPVYGNTTAVTTGAGATAPTSGISPPITTSSAVKSRFGVGVLALALARMCLSMI